MKTEPTAIIEVIRAVALILGMFGIVLTAEEQVVLAGGIAALALLASWALAWWNRNRVYAPETVERIARQAAATGDPSIPDPPAT
jgi:NaMN:DMB phosphoribosyltransferase